MLRERPDNGVNIILTIYVEDLSFKVREYKTLFETTYCDDLEVGRSSTDPAKAHVTLVFMRANASKLECVKIAEALQAELARNAGLRINEPLSLHFKGVQTRSRGNHRALLQESQAFNNFRQCAYDTVEKLLVENESMGERVWLDSAPWRPHVTLYTKLPSRDRYLDEKLVEPLRNFDFGVARVDHLHMDYNNTFKNWNMYLLASAEK